MPPIPKFAQVLAKRAKAKPKVISGSPTTKKIVNTQTKKFAKDDMELAKVRKGSIRKSLEKSLTKRSKDDLNLLKEVNISQMKPESIVGDYKVGEEVNVYDSNNTGKFVKILWPKNPTVENLLFLVRKQIKDKKTQKLQGDDKDNET